MKTNRYKVKLRHDRGVVIITTAATCEDSAKRAVIQSEGCPIESVLGVKLIK